MRVGSLFTGIGGFDLGFERAGMSVAWQCEIEPHARAVLARHWPEVPCVEDVQTVTRALASVAPVDLVCGGFPCQDVSVAGRRAGLAGERSGLWFEFRRVIEELRPRWVVIENVPGLRSSNGGRDFATILGGLAELGYLGAWWSPDAQYFGLAQRRKRVFIVGHLGDGRAGNVLPDAASVCWTPPPRRAEGQEVAGTIGGRSGEGGARLDLDSHGAYVFDLAQVTHPENRSQPSSVLAPSMAATGQLVVGTLTASLANTTGTAGKNGGPAANVVAVQDIQGMKKAQNGSGFGVAVAYTLDATATQGVATTSGIRRLTPREWERLQGFPDDWTAGHADTHRYRMLGNAVAVPVAEWIARRIMEVS